MATLLDPYSFIPNYHRYIREDVFERAVLIEKYIFIKYKISNFLISSGVYTRKVDISITPALNTNLLAIL